MVLPSGPHMPSFGIPVADANYSATHQRITFIWE